MRVGLIEQRTAFINQLRHALGEYYPTALEAFEDWGAISAWNFFTAFPNIPAFRENWQASVGKVLTYSASLA